MNVDLEETLAAMGAEYRDFALRFKNADGAAAPDVRRVRRGFFRRFAAPAAAAALAAAALSPLFTGRSGAPASAAPRASEYSLALSGGGCIDEIVDSQNADGSWGNDFLTRQNAAALRNVASCSVPYRRALRYLRSKGLRPLTDEEMRLRVSLYEKSASGDRT